jgi:ribosomal protein L7/L12
MTQKEKQDIAYILRSETGCGLMEATIAIEKLIEVLKHRPLIIMDNPPRIKITWE